MRAVGMTVGSLAGLVGLLVTVVAFGGGRPGTSAGVSALVALELVTGWVFLAAATVVWSRRPGNPTALLLAGSAAAWFVSLLPWTAGAARLPAGALAVAWPLQSLWAAVLVHLVLAFPSGRLTRPVERLLVAVSYATAVTASLATALTLPTGRQPGSVCSECAPNPLLTVSDATLALSTATAVNLVGAMLAGAIAALVGVRWRNAGLAGRRALTPVLATGAAVTALVAVDTVLTATSRVPARSEPTDVLLVLAVAAVPLGLLAGLLRARLDRADIADALPALAALSAVSTTGGLRELLAGVLRDPSLEVVYRLPAPGTGTPAPAPAPPLTPTPTPTRDVDEHGRPVELTSAAAGRRVRTPVLVDGEQLGTLVHDSALAADDQLVVSAASAAGLAMATARLRAELRARVADVTASRRRLVAAVDAERRRTERDLHDGVQQRLLAVGVLLSRARLAGDPEAGAVLLAQARAEVQAAIGDIRALGQGLRPAALAERGLAGALAELSWTAAIPVTVTWRGPREPSLPEDVETAAYFVVAEAVANAAKHSGAEAASVEIARDREELTVTVSDSGRGGAGITSVIAGSDSDADGTSNDSGNGNGNGTHGPGSGLAGLADRVAAQGGLLEVASPVGGGTTVRARLPCP